MTQGMLRAANGCPSSVYDMPNVSLHRAPWLDPEGGSGWGVGGGGGKCRHSSRRTAREQQRSVCGSIGDGGAQSAGVEASSVMKELLAACDDGTGGGMGGEGAPPV